MGAFTENLDSHQDLKKRKEASKTRLSEIRIKATSNDFSALKNPEVTVFVAGSLGRGEAGIKSDLDIFLLADSESVVPKLDEYEIFADLIAINRNLNFEKFSRDGRFLRIHPLRQLIDVIGKPQDDGDNCFTTRMLLMSESQVIVNEAVYDKAVDKVAANYFRDSRGKKDFRPLFYLNDVLRFWRTLCLNYEELRSESESERPWLKKNLNLKFSRKLTVFSTVLSVVSGRVKDKDSLITITKESPLQRLAASLDAIDDPSLLGKFSEALDQYEYFLKAKEEGVIENISSDRANRVYEVAARKFGDFLLAALSSNKIDIEMRNYIII